MYERTFMVRKTSLSLIKIATKLGLIEPKKVHIKTNMSFLAKNQFILQQNKKI